MALPTVAVIIPYFRAPAALERCTTALHAGSYRNIELFVRDNSEDNLYRSMAFEGLA